MSLTKHTVIKWFIKISNTAEYVGKFGLFLFIVIMFFQYSLHIYMQQQSKSTMVALMMSAEYRQANLPDYLKVHFKTKTTPTYSTVVGIELAHRALKDKDNSKSKPTPGVKLNLGKAKIEEHIEVPNPDKIDTIPKYVPKIKVTRSNDTNN